MTESVTCCARLDFRNAIPTTATLSLSRLDYPVSRTYPYSPAFSGNSP